MELNMRLAQSEDSFLSEFLHFVQEGVQDGSHCDENLILADSGVSGILQCESDGDEYHHYSDGLVTVFESDDSQMEHSVLPCSLLSKTAAAKAVAISIEDTEIGQICHNIVDPFQKEEEQAENAFSVKQDGDIDLYLECNDDGLNEINEQVLKDQQTALIAKNVTLRITFPILADNAITKYTCSKCNIIFKEELELRMHTREHKKFSCELCTYRTTRLYLLKKHLKLKHSIEVSKKQTRVIHKMPQNLPGSSINLDTEECLAEANDRSGILDEETNDEFKTIHLKKTEKFVDLAKLSSHLISCSHCSYEAKSQKLLKMHIGNMHNPERQTFKCDTCLQVYQQKRSYLAHLNSHLDKTNWHSCCVCQKFFHDASSLHRHQKTHASSRPYHCYVENCSQTFKIKSALTNHIKKVHNRKFVRKETSKSDIDRAVQATKDCKSNMKVDKTFICGWKGCGKKFRDNYNLQKHYCLHIGVKNISCPHCQFKCIQKTSLDWHLNKYHSDLTAV
ncbi:hypothetical protein CHS0354_039471 [Potamilus streckersoni]|uniref:C2H2-type domain-containing protein n=1 Tax=Potamilus streckersoni TaxID=2493646 RepID=A0AAE0SY32_9BIVA|nr:hypothetical protein CHS0354_039471 [Potamilus streckersoni]